MAVTEQAGRGHLVLLVLVARVLLWLSTAVFFAEAFVNVLLLLGGRIPADGVVGGADRLVDVRFQKDLRRFCRNKQIS